MIHDPAQLIEHYGYWMLAGLVAVESFGIPVPGETALIAAAIYAATSDDMSIYLVIATAAAAGIAGDNAGFLLGRRFGARLLLRHGKRIGMTDARIKVGQYLFRRHGSRAVFAGRFIPVLRECVSFLAGANRMHWLPFLIANACGASFWAIFYGTGSYLLGSGAANAMRNVQIGIGIGTTLVFVALTIFLYRHEKRLEVKAEKAMPGPLKRSAFGGGKH
ncbi:MAG: DedA family protein [Proteobacteria bacterium]|nr:DedA family protein [Pseudomonadota bacterium]